MTSTAGFTFSVAYGAGADQCVEPIIEMSDMAIQTNLASSSDNLERASAGFYDVQTTNPAFSTSQVSFDTEYRYKIYRQFVNKTVPMMSSPWF